MKRTLCLMLICVTAVFCGHGIDSVSSPSGIPQALQVVSGRTGMLVQNVTISATPDGSLYSASGFLSFETNRRGTIVLRPNDNELPLGYTTAVAYLQGKVIRFGDNVHRVGIIVTPEMRRPDIRTRMEHVMQVANAAQSSITFVLDDYSADLTISITFNARDAEFIKNSALVGLARCTVSSQGIIKYVAIVFPSVSYVEFVDWFEVVLLHELGHALGLDHAPDGVPGLMSASLTGASFAFTPQEKTTLSVNYAHAAGGRLKGSTEYDSGVSISSGDSQEVISICHR